MGKYEEALQALNPAQREAVEAIDGPVLVIAGPGTGKTQLLTTRIAHILAATDTLPQNILCLTFTESAAETMQERLNNMIGQAAYNVAISTYHAFGADIIRRYPEYFAAEAKLQPADDLTIDRIFRDCVRNLPFASPLKYADTYLGDIKTLVSDAKRALLTPADLRAVAQQNLRLIRTVNPVISHTLGSLPRIDKKAIPLFTKLSEALTAELPQTQRSNSIIPEAQPKQSPQRRTDARRVSGLRDDATLAKVLPGSDGGSRGVNALLELASGAQPLYAPFLSSLQEAVAAAEESGKTTSLTAWKNTWLAKDQTGRFIMDGTHANQKLLAAAEIYQQYLHELQTRGLFDYDDMILRAVHALETQAELRYTLQEQYQYILLDEFQDTNEAQLRIVELLTNNPASEGRPNILAVGDDDQAIYAFQGADYSHMLKFKDLYRDVLVVPLTRNYRSHPGILHLARGVAEQIEERLHHHFPAIEKTLTASAKNLPPKAIVERREAGSDVMQYAWVTRRIQELLGQGVEPSDIAVLAPKHRYLEPLVPFLTQAGVPVRYEKRENVLDDPAVNQLLRMAELTLALAAGEQARASALWPQILSAGFWELPTSTIWQLSWQTAENRHDWTNHLLENGQLKPIALFFIRLSQLAGTETLETMMDYLIGTQSLNLNEPGLAEYRSPYYGHYFGSPRSAGPVGSPPAANGKDKLQMTTDVSAVPAGSGGAMADSAAFSDSSKLDADFWNLLTNLIVLRAKLREYRGNQEERLSLGDFVEFVRAHREADLKILNTSPYASAAQAVQLMTAYKAKGLEFKAVFLLAISDEAWGGKARSLGQRISLPPNLQYIRYSGATQDERLRLLYVAITRARAQLYLVGYTQNYAGTHTTRLKYLNETTDEEGRSLSPLLPPGSEQVLTAEDTAPAPSTELAAYWQQRHETALASTDMQALLQDRLKHFRLSATHISDFVDFVHCGPQSFFILKILRFPQAPRAELEYGNAIHETLEWIHYHAKQHHDLPSQAATHKTFAAKLEAKRLSEHDYALYLDRGHAALTAYLAQRAHTIAPTHIVEYNFRNEGVLIGPAHLGGKIDKLIVDKNKKEVTIVDYKTGRSHTKWARLVGLHKNRQQLNFYKALVEGSHTFAGYKVTDAYLEFVEPDEDGRIQELHLPLNDTEYQQTKRLAQAVWQHIMRLHLPDTTAYTPDLKGIEEFEQWLLSGIN